ncbi:MAG: 3-hydroxyacyl-CoA dehydrogenase [Desulfomicrobium sp.]|uniref:3-hydroxyacyl-CoA dehydrogenase n=1 Tax=Hoeflea sp. TaxID=1940281 RepID=UPI0025C6724B|nr:3-hydroxyacyl-CoA dehydrogenase [Hoeflea sp.]MBU4528022.1 3-hydroxyacyl-CoA dehydrogenase [Alphaproteobacteria bacterium]MBV1711952.1 3-hydroxyacyl-CoA dehydrogenase [Desulfomicrobium sp.]MBV1785469.1 3-hydroxyacyl-CoA dehydrogenase [Hoeflea sp.]
MTKVAIIGSGFIGRAWAISFARAGCTVALWDQDRDAAEKAIDFIRIVLPDLHSNDLLNGNTPDQVLAAIRIEDDLTDALAGVDHIQENTPERLELKRTIFARLDVAAPPDAVIASSSSALLPSQFTEALAGRHRCLVVHPINPPYLVPAAEVVPAPWTAPEVVERCRDFLLACGQAPIVMKRELDGFIMNRLQGALMEEAFRLVSDGFASVEDVDIGIRDGLALRWSFMGPFETIDLNAPGGIRDYVERYQGIYENIFTQTQRRVDWAGPVLDTVEHDRRARLAGSDLTERQAWRDRRLMALIAHKRRATDEIGE